MTIAINAKINEGVVLASDSATTLMDAKGNVVNVYNHANKIFNLYKGLPIGVITYGLGNIGHASIATIAKDFREELTEKLDISNYQIKEVADLFFNFVNAKYVDNFKDIPKDKKPPLLGFVVAGYSKGADLSEEYQITLPDMTEPKLLRSIKEIGLSWNGEIEPLTRLIKGYGSKFQQIVHKNINRFKNPQEAESFIIDIHSNSNIALIIPGMPLQDVIDLAEYLAETAVRFAKFRPGAQTVGGPIEIAVISKHEGFKWIKRKHYFDTEHNNIDFVNHLISKQKSTENESKSQ